VVELDGRIDARAVYISWEGIGVIVTCEECSTSFQLDEERIPATGANVRCSRCKHAFFLPNPSASQAEAADSIAAAAAADSAVGIPPVAEDPSPGAAESSRGAEPEEEDWQFSEEIRIEGDEDLNSSDAFGSGLDMEGGLDADALLENVSDQDIADAELDSSAQEQGSEVEAGLDLASGGESGLELESPNPTIEPAADDSDFGTVDDFSSLMEDDDVAPVDLGSDDERLPQGETPTSENSSHYAGSEAGSEAESGGTDDLGDPESWDLVGSDDSVAPRPPPERARVSFAEAILGSRDATDEEFGRSTYDDDAQAHSALWRGAAGLGRGLGWATTIASIATVLFLGLQSEWTRWIQAPQHVSMGPISAETTDAKWLETSRAGFLFVVEGQIRNTGNAIGTPSTLQIVWLDGQGGRLPASPIMAGERLSETVLREASPDDLATQITMAARAFHSAPLAPGESRAFEAIALESEMPGKARRVLLEMTDSSSTIQPSIAADPEE
jgi:predicted Zn finger-like uncharacterized protein